MKTNTQLTLTALAGALTLTAALPTFAADQGSASDLKWINKQRSGCCVANGRC